MTDELSVYRVGGAGFAVCTYCHCGACSTIARITIEIVAAELDQVAWPHRLSIKRASPDHLSRLLIIEESTQHHPTACAPCLRFSFHCRSQWVHHSTSELVGVRTVAAARLTRSSSSPDLRTNRDSLKPSTSLWNTSRGISHPGPTGTKAYGSFHNLESVPPLLRRYALSQV